MYGNITVSNVKKEGDWSDVRKTGRHFALKVVYIIDELLKKELIITKHRYDRKLNCFCESYDYRIFKDVLDTDWQKMKDMVRSTERKYMQ